MTFDKRAKAVQWKKGTLPTNSGGKIGCPYAKKEKRRKEL